MLATLRRRTWNLAGASTFAAFHVPLEHFCRHDYPTWVGLVTSASSQIARSTAANPARPDPNCEP